MNCSKCGKELSSKTNFCPNCGTNQRPPENNLGLVSVKEITPKVAYTNYLHIIGWIIIVLGTIFGISMMAFADTGFKSLDNNIILSALTIIAYSVIVAAIYFGLHKILLKIERIEQRLGIEDTYIPGNKNYDMAIKERMQELGIDENSQEPIPWELKEPTDS